jgi:hypothetical protein
MPTSGDFGGLLGDPAHESSVARPIALSGYDEQRVIQEPGQRAERTALRVRRREFLPRLGVVAAEQKSIMIQDLAVAGSLRLCEAERGPGKVVDER